MLKKSLFEVKNEQCPGMGTGMGAKSFPVQEKSGSLKKIDVIYAGRLKNYAGLDEGSVHGVSARN